jgi:hypothetical protein
MRYVAGRHLTPQTPGSFWITLKDACLTALGDLLKPYFPEAPEVVIVLNRTQATFENWCTLLADRLIIPSPEDLMPVDRRVKHEQLGSCLVYRHCVMG